MSGSAWPAGWVQETAVRAPRTQSTGRRPGQSRSTRPGGGVPRAGETPHSSPGGAAPADPPPAFCAHHMLQLTICHALVSTYGCCRYIQSGPGGWSLMCCLLVSFLHTVELQCKCSIIAQGLPKPSENAASKSLSHFGRKYIRSVAYDDCDWPWPAH